MSEEQISTMARLNAERLMRGGEVSESEKCVIIAGLMLAVDKLSNSFQTLEDRLWSEERMRRMIGEEIQNHWSEERMRHMIGEEIQHHCKATAQAGKCDDEGPRQRSATWVGRMLRSLTGLGAAVLLLAASGCAVVATRSESFVAEEIYPAVRLDAAGWALTCWPAEHGQWGGDYGDPAQWFLAPVITVGCLVDLVPSVAVDTVLLPVDLAFRK